MDLMCDVSFALVRWGAVNLPLALQARPPFPAVARISRGPFHAAVDSRLRILTKL